MDRSVMARATSSDDAPTPGYMYGEIASMFATTVPPPPLSPLFYLLAHRNDPTKLRRLSKDTRLSSRTTQEEEPQCQI